MRADYVVRYSNLTPLVDPAPGPEFPMLASPTAIGVADWPAFSDVDYGAGSGFSSTSSATAEIPLQPYSSMTSDSPKPTMVRRLQTFSRLITRRRPRSEEYQDSSSQSESEIAGHSNRRRILGRTAGMRQLASSVHVGSAGLKPATGTLPSVVSEEATAEVTSTIRSMGLRQAMESGLHAHTYAALFASLLVPVEDQNDQDSELRLAVENSQLEQSSVRSRMSIFFHSWLWEIMVWIGIVLNCAAIAISTTTSRSGKESTLLRLCGTFEHVYLLSFWAEMALQLGLFGSRFFVDMYSVFDIGVLVVSVVPYGICTAMYGSTSREASAFSRMTIARTLRLLRVVSALRHVIFFREFGILVRGLTSSFRVLFWGLLMAFLIIFMFSVPITTYISEGEFKGKYNGWYLDMIGIDIHEYSQARFGTLPRTMHSLFSVLTLDGWVEMIDPIVNISPLTWWIFVTFVAIGCFAFLNLLTAVIVESALNFSKDEDMRLDLETTDARIRIQRRIERDRGTDILTKADYVSLLRTNPSLAQLLRSFGCNDIDDVHSICDILADPDDPQAHLPIKEFLIGIQRFKTGAARSKDLLEALSRLSILENLVRRHHANLREIRVASKRSRLSANADLQRLQELLDKCARGVNELSDLVQAPAQLRRQQVVLDTQTSG